MVPHTRRSVARTDEGGAQQSKKDSVRDPSRLPQLEWPHAPFVTGASSRFKTRPCFQPEQKCHPVFLPPRWDRTAGTTTRRGNCRRFGGERRLRQGQAATRREGQAVEVN